MSMNNSEQPIYPCIYQQVGENTFRPSKDNDPKEYKTPMGGLTKREYYSGLAMQGLLANPKSAINTTPILFRILNFIFPSKTKGSFCTSNRTEIAKSAILQADELLKQLDNENK